LLGSLTAILSKESCDCSAGCSLQSAHRLFVFDLNAWSFIYFFFFSPSAHHRTGICKLIIVAVNSLLNANISVYFKHWCIELKSDS